MEAYSLSTEVILSHSQAKIDKLTLDWTPQPGDYLDLGNTTYAVLERRHCYQYRGGRYQLAKISLYVQVADRPKERSLIEGRWIIGDASCSFNARSELIRCAVLPIGPCAGCKFYQES